MPEVRFLTEKIHEDAKTSMKQILAKADSQVEDILEEAREEAGAIWSRMKERALRDAEAEKRRILSSKTLEEKKKILAAKQDIIDSAFDMAAKKLRKMDDEKYEEFLANMAVELSTDEHARIFVAYNDRSRLSADFIDRVNKLIEKAGKKTVLSYSDVDYDINEGFIIIQDKYQIDVSIHTLLNIQREEIENRIVEMLLL
jgi:V/A-type H+/Na+-transporting ATPase subunit E